MPTSVQQHLLKLRELAQNDASDQELIDASVAMVRATYARATTTDDHRTTYGVALVAQQAYQVIKEELDVSANMVCCNTRIPAAVSARRIIAGVCRELSHGSLPEIAAVMSRKSHASIGGQIERFRDDDLPGTTMPAAEWTRIVASRCCAAFSPKHGDR